MKIFICFLFISIYTTGFSQDIRILYDSVDVTGQTIVVKTVPDSSYQTPFSIFNNSNTKKIYTSRRILHKKLMTDYSVLYGLDILHYPPYSDSIYTPTDTFELKPHQYLSPGFSSFGLTAYLFTGATCDDFLVSYELVDAITSSKSLIHIHYMCVTGINAVEKDKIKSNMYPNPASSLVTIDYELDYPIKNARLEFINILGRSTGSVVITEGKGKITMDTATLPPGIYLCAFVIDNQVVHAEKLMVTRTD